MSQIQENLWTDGKTDGRTDRPGVQKGGILKQAVFNLLYRENKGGNKI